MKKKKYDKSERKFRAGTFFAGLLSVLTALGICVSSIIIGVDLFFGQDMDKGAQVVFLVTGFGLVGPLIFLLIGLVFAVPLFIFGVIDMITGFQPDRIFKYSTVYESVFTALTLAIGLVILLALPDMGSPAGSLIAVCAIAGFAVCGLRVLSIGWFIIRWALGKAQPEAPVKYAPPSAPTDAAVDFEALKGLHEDRHADGKEP